MVRLLVGWLVDRLFVSMLACFMAGMFVLFSFWFIRVLAFLYSPVGDDGGRFGVLFMSSPWCCCFFPYLTAGLHVLVRVPFPIFAMRRGCGSINLSAPVCACLDLHSTTHIIQLTPSILYNDFSSTRVLKGDT